MAPGKRETVRHPRLRPRRVPPRKFQDITHPDDLPAELERVNNLLSGGAREYSVDKRYLAKGGRYMWANHSFSLVRDPSGEPSYFISVIEVMDERKGAELALRSLTAREMEVLGFLARGRTNKEFSRSLRQRAFRQIPRP